MDGAEMSLHIEKGNNIDFWAESLPEGISILRPFDIYIIVAALISFIVAVVYAVYQSTSMGAVIYEVIPWLALPFFICGLMYYLRVKYWVLLIFVAVAVILWYVNVPQSVIFLFMFVIVGAAGVVSLADAIQRLIFYKVLRSIEYLNVKKKLTMTDKVVSFLFNVPEDMDTRNITMDHDLHRTKIPWKDVGGTVSLGLMVGLFIWIYISMNPSFMNLSNEGSIPLFMFTLILYIPVIVLPWVIFRSLNVRVETNYRSFNIYKGIKATLARMAVPVVGALFFVLLAINTSSLVTVAYYIALSAVMIVVIVAFASFLYYWLFESVIVNDIVSKWKMFRPVPVFVGLKQDNGKQTLEEVPGTPTRDKNDFGSLTFPEEK